MSVTKSSLSLLRGILRELRLTLGAAASADGQQATVRLKDSPAARLVIDQFRKHQVTDKLHCKAAEEMRHLADSYATYLRSQRLWLATHEEYHAKGERSVKETAQIVGFKLPHDPK